jgi:hypothetical protein
LIQQIHELSLLFPADEQFTRVIFKVGRCVGQRLESICFAIGFAPALNTFLMSDAEQPAAEFRVITQAANVSRGSNECLLNDVERRLLGLFPCGESAVATALCRRSPYQTSRRASSILNGYLAG